MQGRIIRRTKGKDERFHRTLKEELLDTRQWRSISHCQEQFDRWRHTYNTVRPHDSLDLETPASIYRPSLRRHPGRLDPASYADGVLVRKVTANGRITLDYKSYFLGHAYAGEKVGLVEAARPGSFNVYFLKNKISTINT